MKKAAKIRLIILSSILGLILLLFATLGLFYLYADSVVFDHIDTSIVPVREGVDAPSNDEYPVNYPWFGNPLMLLWESGRGFGLFFGHGGEKNLSVYMAVNDPIVMWIDYLSERYDRQFIVDYTLEQDSKSISVYFKGTAEDSDGSSIPLDQTFLLDIENASPDNLPTWLNEDELDEECREYWNFLLNYETVPMPEWLEEKLGAV